jgi:exopolysaccharide production protein ExoZ
MRTLAGIQTMRGVAALSVVFGHLVTTRPDMGIGEATANATLGFLQSGVDVFFVISGFIISISAAEIAASNGRLGAFGFAVKRAVRIYPVYWAALAAAFFSSYFLTIGPSVFSDQMSLGTIFLTARENWFVPQAWSMCFEVHFYVAVAAVLLLMPKHVMEVLLVGAGVLAALHLVSSLPQVRTSVFGHPLTLEFGLGVAVGYIVKRGFSGLWRASLLLSAVFFAAGIYLKIAPGEAALSRVATYGIGSALLIYAVVAGEIQGMRFPRPMQYLGAMSYSLYVWHFLIFKWLAAFVILPRLPGQIQMTVWVVVVVAASAASYELIERRGALKVKSLRPSASPSGR